MSKYTEFYERFHRLRNKRLDHAGGRTKKRKLTDGRYIRLYVTIHCSYDIHHIYGQPYMYRDAYSFMVYNQRYKNSYDQKDISVDTLVQRNVLFKYTNETFTFVNEICQAVRNNELTLAEARSIVRGESLAIAAHEVDYELWQDEMYKKMRDEQHDKEMERYYEQQENG